MKKKFKIIGALLLIPISTIGLASCSGATVTPPVVEPPVEPPVVIPPTPMVKLWNVNLNDWKLYKVEEVDSVELKESIITSVTPNIKGLEYSIKLKNGKIESAKVWGESGEKYKPYIQSYNNWLEVSNER